MKRLLFIVSIFICSVSLTMAQDVDLSPTPASDVNVFDSSTPQSELDVFDSSTPGPEVDALNSAIIDAFYTVNNDTPALGERLTVTLVVDMPIDAELVEWPELEGDEKLEIIEYGEIEESVTETRRTMRQETEAILWDLGEYLSEEKVLSYFLNGQQGNVPVRSFFAFVPSQIAENATDITARPSVLPIDLPYMPQWTYSAGIAAVIILALIVARLLQAGKKSVVKIVSGSPTQVAIAQLEDMKLQDLPASAIYALVADYLREFLQMQFGIEATEMTTGELSDTLSEANLLSRDQRQGLHQLLEQADLVKFARFEPDSHSGMRLINYAINWLREAERYSAMEVTLND